MFTIKVEQILNCIECADSWLGSILILPLSSHLNAILQPYSRNSYESQMIDLKFLNEENINVITVSHKAAVEVLRSDLQITVENLRNITSTLVLTENEKESVIVDLSFIEQELKEEKTLRIQDQDSARVAAENFLALKIEEIDRMHQDGEERMQLLIEHNELNLQTEIGVYIGELL